jgi:hypothetical protein
MKNLAWLNPHSSLHTYGIELMTKDPSFLVEFKIGIISTCNKLNCRFFLQGQNIEDWGSNSWLFVEFFGESSEDKILSVIDIVSKMFSNKLYNNEVMLDEPERELFVKLGFLKS